MSASGSVEVRIFGRLHTLRRERGLPTTLIVEVPPEGMAAREVAVSLELPLEQIEGIFCNHTIYGLGHVIMPGDRLAFVPPGTPGPHRVFLNLHRADDGDENEK